MLRRPTRLLFFALLGLLPAPELFTRASLPTSLAAESFQQIAPGKYVHYRAAFELELPGVRRLAVSPRGNFVIFEFLPPLLAEEDYYILMTSFRIRRPVVEKEIRDIVPCKLEGIPAAGDFDVSRDCAGRIDLNEMKRAVRIVRRGNILHVLFVSGRSEHSAVFLPIVIGARLNAGFTLPQ